MPGALAAGGVAIAVADRWLAIVSVRDQTVLGGLLALVGLALVAFAITSGPSGSLAEGALLVALIFLGVGGALDGLGQLFERLLDDAPDHET